MAFTLPAIYGVMGLANRTLLMALLYSTAVVLVAACGDGDEPAATALPTTTPEPTATPVPAATALPTTTPEPTATPVAGEFSVELTPETRWQDLFDAFTELERDCIRAELGAELVKTVSQRFVMSEGETQSWEPLVFGCLYQGTASAEVPSKSV